MNVQQIQGLCFSIYEHVLVCSTVKPRKGPVTGTLEFFPVPSDDWPLWAEFCCFWALLRGSHRRLSLLACDSMQTSHLHSLHTSFPWVSTVISHPRIFFFTAMCGLVGDEEHFYSTQGCWQYIENKLSFHKEQVSEQRIYPDSLHLEHSTWFIW